MDFADGHNGAGARGLTGDKFSRPPFPHGAIRTENAPAYPDHDSETQNPFT
ncbi:hypothetical protein LG047_03470 [Methylocystis sp. WRRC1]|uniref:hypothetical protein n=1 Tax=Methylocystis sp. WRRC1 TaxID=1732014 RepID=UPI001D132C52|nr:hypothetical protein [Methylocystis sp. WRRC1]MCC3244392.1 hypothetical protein [Methylocystis sp. WRRC1]